MDTFMSNTYVGPAFEASKILELLEKIAQITDRWPSPEPFQHVLWRWNPAENNADAFALQVETDLAVLGPTARAPNGACAIIQGPQEEKERDTRMAILWAAAHSRDED